jgi:hypothetical protein
MALHNIYLTFLSHCVLEIIANLKFIRYQDARTVILPVFYVCETWSHTLREERRLRVFANRVLRRNVDLRGPT